MAYPLYYIIKANPPQPDLVQMLTLLRQHRVAVEQIRDTKHEKSRKIELLLKPGLAKLGYLHSVTNEDYPLFAKGSQFEVDFYNRQNQAAVEIERSNLYTKVWLALFKMLESNLIRHGMILVPIRRIVRNAPEHSFRLTAYRLRDNAVNLLCHLDSLVVVGY